MGLFDIFRRKDNQDNQPSYDETRSTTATSYATRPQDNSTSYFSTYNGNDGHHYMEVESYDQFAPVNQFYDSTD